MKKLNLKLNVIYCNQVMVLILLLILLHGCNEITIFTPIEKNNYEKIPSVSEVNGYLSELSEKHNYVQTIKIGESAANRPIMGLLISTDRLFLQEHKSSKNKLKIILLGAQHGMEPSGAEALQQLARDLVFGELKSFLDDFDFIIIPVSNPDGYDLKKRVNGNKVNLSTDYMMLSQPETRAIVDIIQKIKPHVSLDVHESALLKKKSLGAQGYLTDVEAQFEVGNNSNVEPELLQFSLKTFLPDLLESLNKKGLRASRYIGEITNINQVITHGGISLRNLRNFSAFHGTLSMLLENRLDPPGNYPTIRNIKERIRKQKLSITTFLEQVQSYRKAILEKVQIAQNHYNNIDNNFELSLVSRYEIDPNKTNINITLRRIDSGKLVQKQFEYHSQIIADNKVKLPLAYVVTERQQLITALLKRHKIPFEIINKQMKIKADGLMINKIEIIPAEKKWQKRTVKIISQEKEQSISVKPGDIWINAKKPQTKLVPLLFDPRSIHGLFHDHSYYITFIPKKLFFISSVNHLENY